MDCARSSCLECGHIAQSRPEGSPAALPQARALSRRAVRSKPREHTPGLKQASFARTGKSLGCDYLATAGTSLLAAQINATNQPITLHPRNKFSRKIASVSRLLRRRAMIDGRKYITRGKPSNGKKNTDKRCIRRLLMLLA